MSRAYLRLDPGFFDRKVIDQKYPPGAVVALIGALCHAESQPVRGRFRDARVLKALLGPHARWITYLVEHRDLIVKRGQLYVDGWDEWQEGDWKVGERVQRIRNRQREESAGGAVTVPVTPAVTVPVTVGNESGDSVGTVYNLSDGGRQSVIDSGSGSGKQEDPLSTTRGRGRASGRADIAALHDRGWKRVTKKQRAVLDEVLERHDVTGPEFAAAAIRATPADRDPLESVMAADRMWQDAQRRAADADETAWAATKAEERAQAEPDWLTKAKAPS